MTPALALWIVALFLCGFVVWVFLDQVHPWNRREDAFITALRGLQAQQLELIDRLAAAQEKTISEIVEMVQGVASATTAQAEAFRSHLEMFQNSSPARSWVVREEDEEREALARSGFPVDANPAEQAKWVAEQARAGW